MKYVLMCNQKLRIATLGVAMFASLNVSAQELKFEQAFTGESTTLHYQAEYRSKGVAHHLEVWRDGEKRVRRRADDAIETFAFHQADDQEFQMSILDLKKHIHTRIDRTNLYRIGNFTDWFDLAHGLKHPIGEYRIAKSDMQHEFTKPIGACNWLDLTQKDRVTHICWSKKASLPLAIQNQEGEVLWKVTSLDMKPISAKIFAINDTGFIRNDANQDIEND